MSTVIATRAPRPPMNGSGSRKPNMARLGIVCATLTSQMRGAPRRGRRVAKIASGIPIATAAVVDTATSPRCCSKQAEKLGTVRNPELQDVHRSSCPPDCAPGACPRNACVASTSGCSIARTCGSGFARDRLWHVECHEHAISQDADARAKRQRLTHVVGDDHDRLAHR